MNVSKINTSKNYEDRGDLVKNTLFQTKVMVIDDQPHSLLYVVDLLIYHGCEVVPSFDSTNVVTLALEHDPDVILMDVFMPEVDGLMAVEKLKANSRLRDIPVILMSVTDEPRLWRTARSAGVTDVMIKPLDMQVLGNRLRALTQQKKAINQWKVA